MRFSTTTLLLLLGAASILQADVKPSTMFGDGMVLQCEMEVPVWGEATPDEMVTVEFAGQSKSTQADAAGKWMIRLDALTASDKVIVPVEDYIAKIKPCPDRKRGEINTFGGNILREVPEIYFDTFTSHGVNVFAGKKRYLPVPLPRMGITQNPVLFPNNSLHNRALLLSLLL